MSWYVNSLSVILYRYFVVVASSVFPIASAAVLTPSVGGAGCRAVTVPATVGWGHMGFTWHKNVRNRGVLAAGADCWCEDTPEKEQLTFIYGGVRHSERGRSGSSTAGRAHFECNQDGHMSRDCPPPDDDTVAEAASSVAKKAT
ncbi:hypothetical protein HPB49_006778 [Dermacentor silvarum]|uniref:Uncharacterized protein n=1 Tax=Dermacentor silvarum TaxID=543639 RepID=A0ACB8DWZ9_DERSI|nr:hypothetical protein HPB49_006778 [Dermacentor silvarum]